MTIEALILVSRQGKVRLSKFYSQSEQDTKIQQRIIREICNMVLSRSPNLCNFLEYHSRKVVYKRYASLYFITLVSEDENELITLEKIHLFVEVLDKYFGNVCELDIIFNFHKAYFVLDEIFLSGELVDSNKTNLLKIVQKQDEFADAEEERMRQKMTLKKLFS